MFTKPKVSLSTARDDNRVMTWSSNLNIYRVNRFSTGDADRVRRPGGVDPVANVAFDLVEALLYRNMVHVVEAVFNYVGLESACDCLLVCRLWNEFLSRHVFRRWAERLIAEDSCTRDLAAAERWTRHFDADEVDDEDEDDVDNSAVVSDKALAFGRICRRLHALREVWRCREPKLRRLHCDSFVLSLRFVDEADRPQLYCGLNNGCLQLWDLDWAAKAREQELHDKGVKCVDVGTSVFVTGSYDCTAKVWRRDAWTILHVITLHTDSVWDLRLHDHTLVTAGLDGTVGVFDLRHEGVGTQRQAVLISTKFLVQAHDDLVSAIDFDNRVLLTGYEDSRIGVWDLALGASIGKLEGHAGGVTGLQLDCCVVASASYDGTVRLWNVVTMRCLHVFNEPGHFVRCVAFRGHSLACGDFGGYVHVWDVQVSDCGQVSVRAHRSTHAHKGHVVCVQLDARRIITGSRDKTALVQDFWAKMVDAAKNRASRRARPSHADPAVTPRYSRFLRR